KYINESKDYSCNATVRQEISSKPQTIKLEILDWGNSTSPLIPISAISSTNFIPRIPTNPKYRTSSTWCFCKPLMSNQSLLLIILIIALVIINIHLVLSKNHVIRQQ